MHLCHYSFFFLFPLSYYYRPFGYNEFDGAGSGYAIKFASLSNIDENVVVGSTPATGENAQSGPREVQFSFYSEYIISFKGIELIDESHQYFFNSSKITIIKLNDRSVIELLKNSKCGRKLLLFLSDLKIPILLLQYTNNYYSLFPIILLMKINIQSHFYFYFYSW